MVIDREEYKKLVGEYRALSAVLYTLDDRRGVRCRDAIGTRLYELTHELGFTPEINRSYIDRELSNYDTLRYSIRYGFIRHRVKAQPQPKLKGI